MFSNIKQFFERNPDFGAVPTIKTQLDWKRELLTIRPNFLQEGWTLLLRLTPNKISFVNNIICILLARELSFFERDYLLKILPLFALDQKNFHLSKLEFVRGLILINGMMKRSEIWAKAGDFEEVVGFKPTKSLTGIQTRCHCEKVWFNAKKVILPQRKRGYDDKGNLPPKDCVSWRELASNSEFQNFQIDVEKFPKPTGIWQYAVDAATEESKFLDEIPLLRRIL